MQTIYQQLLEQSQLLAHTDVFMMCSSSAFMVAPLALLFSNSKRSGGGSKSRSH